MAEQDSKPPTYGEGDHGFLGGPDEDDAKYEPPVYGEGNYGFLGGPEEPEDDLERTRRQALGDLAPASEAPGSQPAKGSVRPGNPQSAQSRGPETSR